LIIEKTKRLLPSVLILCCFLLAVLGPSYCSAVEVWSEDFEDDPPLGEWEVSPSATVVDGCFRGDGLAAEVYRPCDITSGSWSLDVLDVGSWGLAVYSAVFIYFMTSDPEATAQTYYCLKISQGGVAAGLKYIYAFTKRGEGTSVTLASGDGIEGTDLAGTLHHIRVTRSTTGHMSAYVNETLVVEATDNEITTSEYFRIVLTYDYAIDNIVVDDAPPLDVPLEYIIIGIGIVAIVVVIAIIVKRRR
jgi:hypothetical protein